MNKYKVEFTQKETFIVDVFAKNEDEARRRAEEGFNKGDYQEVGDCEVEVSTVYDVSGTDDPFFPINEPKSGKVKQYIITDPCYIMNDAQYQKICDDGCDFEGQNFPLKSTREKDGEPIVFHIIEQTPFGDGGYTFRGQDIGVDAGLLCVAFCEKGWNTEHLGATFSKLDVAMKNFPKILEHF